MPHPRSSKSTTRSAFTLVELLTVIAILGVLSTLLLPAVKSIRASARSTICSNNLRKIIIACNHYVADYGAYPSNIWSQPNLIDESTGKTKYNDDQIVKYIDPKYTANSPWVLECPDVTIALSKNGGDIKNLKSISPSEITYGFNEEMHKLKPAAIRNPARLVAFQEKLSKSFSPGNGSKDVGDYVVSRHGYRASGDRMDLEGRGTKCAFADGHIGELRYQGGKWNLGSTNLFLIP